MMVLDSNFFRFSFNDFPIFKGSNYSELFIFTDLVLRSVVTGYRLPIYHHSADYIFPGPLN